MSDFWMQKQLEYEARRRQKERQATDLHKELKTLKDNQQALLEMIESLTYENAAMVKRLDELRHLQEDNATIKAWNKVQEEKIAKLEELAYDSFGLSWKDVAESRLKRLNAFMRATSNIECPICTQLGFKCSKYYVESCLCGGVGCYKCK